MEVKSFSKYQATHPTLLDPNTIDKHGQNMFIVRTELAKAAELCDVLANDKPADYEHREHIICNTKLSLVRAVQGISGALYATDKAASEAFNKELYNIRSWLDVNIEELSSKPYTEEFNRIKAEIQRISNDALAVIEHPTQTPVVPCIWPRRCACPKC